MVAGPVTMACHWPLALTPNSECRVMEHGVAFFASVPDLSVYADLAAIFDQATVQFNNRYVFQEDRRVVAAAAYGAGILAARITTPTMRLISYPEIYAVNQAVAPTGLNAISLPGEHGPLVVMNDEMAVQVSQTSGGASACYGLVWTDPQPRPAPQGQTTTVKCTGAITGVTNSWVSGPLTFVQQLPAGRYVVTGFDVAGTNLLAARLIFPNQPTRPMVQATGAVTQARLYQWRFGNHGYLGDFHTYAPPQLEILQTGANTSQQVVLDVVRVGNQ